LDRTTDPGKKWESFLYKSTLQKVQNAITTEINLDDIVLKKGNSDAEWNKDNSTMITSEDKT
jgi:hypothetical protein